MTEILFVLVAIVAAIGVLAHRVSRYRWALEVIGVDRVSLYKHDPGEEGYHRIIEETWDTKRRLLLRRLAMQDGLENTGARDGIQEWIRDPGRGDLDKTKVVRTALPRELTDELVRLVEAGFILNVVRRRSIP